MKKLYVLLLICFCTLSTSRSGSRRRGSWSWPRHRNHGGGSSSSNNNQPKNDNSWKYEEENKRKKQEESWRQNYFNRDVSGEYDKAYKHNFEKASVLVNDRQKTINVLKAAATYKLFKSRSILHFPDNLDNYLYINSARYLLFNLNGNKPGTQFNLPLDEETNLDCLIVSSDHTLFNSIWDVNDSKNRKCGVIFKEKIKINSTFYPVSHYGDTREETPNILCCVNPINITEIQLNNNYISNSTQFNYILLNSTEASYVTDPTVDYYNETVFTEDVTFENYTEFYNQSDSDARSFNQSNEFPRGSGRGTKYSLTMTLFFMMSIFAFWF